MGAEAQATQGPSAHLEGTQVQAGAVQLQVAPTSTFPTDMWGTLRSFYLSGQGPVLQGSDIGGHFPSGSRQSGVQDGLAAGRPRDHQYGGAITCPDCTSISMAHTKGIWTSGMAER